MRKRRLPIDRNPFKKLKVFERPPQLYAKEKKSGERMRKELLKTACVHRREVGVLSAEADRRGDFAVTDFVVDYFKFAQVKQHLLGDDSRA